MTSATRFHKLILLLLFIQFINVYIASSKNPPPPSDKDSLLLWKTARPIPDKPLGGYPMLSNLQNTQVYHGNDEIGHYNHAVMVDYFNGTFIVMWKNGVIAEDRPGQRILYAQSTDGLTWTKTDGRNILFPNISLDSFAVAQFVGPAVHIDGRQYVAASPGNYDGHSKDTAQGVQFCLWPDPIDPRNCGPPGQKQHKGILMFRRVLPGLHSFGPIFWASGKVSSGFEKATELFNIRTLNQMDQQTQSDIATLTPKMDKLPCGDPTESGNLKCEACEGGCAPYDVIDEKIELANERAHYIVPSTSGHVQEQRDIIVYRSHSRLLWVSERVGIDESWSSPSLTQIPNDDSNINTGVLPDGRIFLLGNLVTDKNGTGDRDPLSISLSSDGYTFDKTAVVQSCHFIGGDTHCVSRTGHGNNGPSYPQGLALSSPAPSHLRGLYVASSINKEDIWVTKIPFDELDTM